MWVAFLCLSILSLLFIPLLMYFRGYPWKRPDNWSKMKEKCHKTDDNSLIFITFALIL